MALAFEWDSQESTAKLRKHGVSFNEAASVFGVSLMHGKQREEKENIMKKSRFKGEELRPEYNLHQLKGVVRGKYARQYRAGTNLVHLEPDVAKVFANDQSVNEALRSLMRLAKAH